MASAWLSAGILAAIQGRQTDDVLVHAHQDHAAHKKAGKGWQALQQGRNANVRQGFVIFSIASVV
jgi:hypothetical protein